MKYDGEKFMQPLVLIRNNFKKMSHPTRGPAIFLNRLQQELKKYDTLKNFKIFLPNHSSKKEMSNFNGLRVGRLDGSFFYDFSKKNFKNFSELRKHSLLQKINLNLSPFNQNLNAYLNRYSKYLLNNSDIIVYQSDWSKKMQDKFVGKSKSPYTIINNGVPLDVFSFRKKELNEEINLVITSNFRPHKRLFDAILLINRLKNKVPKIRLKVVGKIDSITLKAIQNLDLSNCDFLGMIPSDRIPQVYKNCVLGLSPAIFDPCPNSVVEMMACGLPVISCEESGASELIGVSDLCVKENLELKYYEFQTIERLPKINLKSWEDLVLLVLENYKTYQEKIQIQVESRLDIKIICAKYLNFFKKHQDA